MLEPASGRLTGAGQRPRPAARAGRALPGGCPGAGPGRRRADARPGRPAGGGLRRRHPRGTRPGPLPRQLVLRPAGLRAGQDRRRPRRRGDAGRRPTSSLPDPAGAKVDPGDLGRADARRGARRRRRRRRGRDGRGRRGLPARDAGARRRSRRPAAGPEPLRAGREPRHPARAVRAPRPRPGQVIVGFAAETEDLLAQRAGQARRQGMRPAGRQPGRARAWRSAPPTTRRWSWAPTAAVTRVPRGPKEVLADVVWDLVAARLG